MNHNSSKNKILGIIGAFLSLIIPFFIKILNEGEALETKQSLCPFKMLTGFPCPGCGITKSIISFYEGNILESLTYHIFGIPAVLFCIAIIFIFIYEIFFKTNVFSQFLYNKKLGIALGIALGTFHLARLFMFIKNNSIDSVVTQSIWK